MAQKDNQADHQEQASEASIKSPTKRPSLKFSTLQKFRSRQAKDKVVLSRTQKIIKRLLFIILYAAIVFGGAYGLFTYNVHRSNSNAEKVSDQIVMDILKDDPRGVYALSSSNFKSKTTEATVATNIPKMLPILKGKSWGIVGWTYKKTNGKEYDQVLYKFIGKKSSYYLQMIMVNENGHWLLYHFNASSKQFSGQLTNIS